MSYVFGILGEGRKELGSFLHTQLYNLYIKSGSESVKMVLVPGSDVDSIKYEAGTIIIFTVVVQYGSCSLNN